MPLQVQSCVPPPPPPALPNQCGSQWKPNKEEANGGQVIADWDKKSHTLVAGQTGLSEYNHQSQHRCKTSIPSSDSETINEVYFSCYNAVTPILQKGPV